MAVVDQPPGEGDTSQTWNTLVVLVQGSVNAWGKPSAAAEKVKQALLLSAESAAADPDVFQVISRKDLEGKGAKDAKALAAALRQRLKQDRVKGLAAKQKLAKKRLEALAVAQDAAGAEPPPAEDDDPQEANLVIQRNGTGEVEESATALRLAAIERELSADETIEVVSDPASLVAARTALALEGEAISPDKIYILSDFPATREEASLLIPGAGRDGVMDAVVELVGGQREQGQSVAVRAASRVSQHSTKTVPAVGNRSHDGGPSSDLHGASAASLPLPSLSSLHLHDAPLGAERPASSLSQASNASSEVSGPRSVMRGAASPVYADGVGYPPNDLVASLKEAQACANGPGWKDVVFLELGVVPEEGEDEAPYRPLATLSRFSTLVYSVAVEKARFLAYLSKCKRVQVPLCSVGASPAVLEEYTTLVESIPFEMLRSVAVVLDCMVGAVAAAGGEGVATQQAKPRGEDEACKADSRASEALQAPQQVALGDCVRLRLAQASARGDVSKSWMSRILRAESGLWSRVSVPGGTGRKWMPRWATLSAVERGLASTQFAALHNLDEGRLEFVRCIAAFEKLLRRGDPRAADSWDFSGRRFKRLLSADVATQVLASAMGEEAQVHSTYLAQYDELLVAIHRRTPLGRACSLPRSAFGHTNLRPTLSEWASHDLRAPECIFDVEPESLAKLHQEARLLFPCDQGVIALESRVGTDQAWCTVYKDGHRFGLRKAPTDSAPRKPAGDKQGATATPAAFFASFSDDSFLELSQGGALAGKPDGLPTMVACYTSSDGLHVRLCSDGTVRMQRGQSEARPPTQPKEIERLILGAGSVVRFFEDGTSQVLFANGDVRRVLTDGSRETSTFRDGGYIVSELGEPRGETQAPFASTPKARGSAAKTVLNTGNVQQRATRVHVVEAIDPETQAVVHTRANDRTRRTRLSDGSVLVEHADGTTILTSTSTANETEVRVECEGFGTVKIIREVEETAFQHSRGARVDISKGGRRIRSSTLLPDATVAHIEYDTRVTAKINGSMRILKPDGTAVEAQDDGTVSWRPWNVDTLQRENRVRVTKVEDAKQLAADAREEPDRDLACYRFNCGSGSLRLRDWESNTFEVDAATSKSRRQERVILSGAFDPVQAVVNYPLVPRLFVMRGDGTGAELLTEEQISNERLRCERVHRQAFMSTVGEAPESTLQGLEKTQAVSLRIGTRLKQLSTCRDRLPPSCAADDAASAFERRDGASAASPSQEWHLVDAVVEYAAVSPEEREAVQRGDARYASWLAESVAKEDRFNVDDTRSEAAVAEERKMQAMILKERRKVDRAEKKRERKQSEMSSQASQASGGQHTHRSSASVQSGKSRQTGFRMGELNECDEDGALLGNGSDGAAQDGDERERKIDEEAHDYIGGDWDEAKSAHAEARPVCPTQRHAPLREGLNFWKQAPP